MAEQQLDQLDEQYILKLNMMEAMTRNEAGISFLQWLHRLTGFGRPTMSLEDASRRDVWITIRAFIPVDRLSEIEHFDLRQQQEMVHLMVENLEVNEDE